MSNAIPVAHADHAAIPAGTVIAQARPRFGWLAALCCLVLLLSVIAELVRFAHDRRDAKSAAQIEKTARRDVRLDQIAAGLIPMPAGVPSAHSSALAPLPGNQMLAFWWAGSRESGPDVKVYASRYADGKWSPSREIASRDSLGAALGYGVRRIGNTVAWTTRDGAVNLFVVTTGLGGWAASRVVQLISTDLGETFTVKRVLPMSPLFNTSVLVRSAPVELADGGWWLPAHFELGIKYPLIMSFDKHGDPRWMARIGTAITTLQPTVVHLSEFEAHAWMRDASDQRRVQQAISRDGGASWEDLPAVDMANNSSSVAALRLSSGGFLMLHNYVAEGSWTRNVLRLSQSKDARTWTTLFDIASGKPEEEFSYPTLRQVGSELHVSYTSRRTAIAHRVYRITDLPTP